MKQKTEFARVTIKHRTESATVINVTIKHKTESSRVTNVTIKHKTESARVTNLIIKHKTEIGRLTNVLTTPLTTFFWARRMKTSEELGEMSKIRLTKGGWAAPHYLPPIPGPERGVKGGGEEGGGSGHRIQQNPKEST